VRDELLRAIERSKERLSKEDRKFGISCDVE